MTRSPGPFRPDEEREEPLDEREIAALRELLVDDAPDRTADAVHAVEWQVALEDVGLLLIEAVPAAAALLADVAVNIQTTGSAPAPDPEEP